MWKKQLEICDSVERNVYTAIRSANSVGKTYILAGIIHWFLTTKPYSKVITTANSWRQVRFQLWATANRLYKGAKYPLGGKMNDTDYKIDDDWYGVGISPKDEANFQGYHAPEVLVIFDEACDLRKSYYAAGETLMSNDRCRWIASGNPLSKNTEFYKLFSSDKRWNRIHISALDHPNVKTGREIFPGAVTKGYVKSIRDKYGEDSPFWQIKILGNFVNEVEGNYLFRAIDVERSFDAEFKLIPDEPIHIGCDPARYGGCETCIYGVGMHSKKVIEKRHLKKTDTQTIVGEMIAMRHRIRADLLKVESIGADIGAGVIDLLREKRQPVYTLNPAVGGDEKYLNNRVRMYDNISDLFKKNQVDLGEKDEVIEEQLMSIRYKFNSRGQMMLESKDDMRARGKESPDRSDALAIAFFPVGTVSFNQAVEDNKNSPNRITAFDGDTNPFEDGW